MFTVEPVKRTFPGSRISRTLFMISIEISTSISIHKQLAPEIRTPHYNGQNDWSHWCPLRNGYTVYHIKQPSIVSFLIEVTCSHYVMRIT